eukprot:gene15477-biopygen10097
MIPWSNFGGRRRHALPGRKGKKLAGVWDPALLPPVFNSVPPVFISVPPGSCQSRSSLHKRSTAPAISVPSEPVFFCHGSVTVLFGDKLSALEPHARKHDLAYGQGASGAEKEGGWMRDKPLLVIRCKDGEGRGFRPQVARIELAYPALIAADSETKMQCIRIRV